MSAITIVLGAVAIWAALTLLTIAFVYRATKGRDK